MILTDRQVSYALNDCRLLPLRGDDSTDGPQVALDGQAASHRGPDVVLTSAPALPPALRPHPLLRLLPLDENHVVAFVPSVSAIAVLNQAAIAQIRNLPGAEQDTIPELRRLYEIGLLSTEDIPSDPEPPEPEVLVAWLHVSNACNLRCTYCYVQKNQDQMDTETARDAVDAIVRSAVTHGYRGITLKYAGGEPLLNLPVIVATHKYALEQAAHYGLALQSGVLSNGALITDAHIVQLRDLGIGLTISVDGLGETHDAQRPTRGGQPSSQATLRGVERALAGGVVPSIAVTVSRANIEALPDLIAWVLHRGLEFTLSFARDSGCTASANLQTEEAAIIAGMRRVYAVVEQHLPRWSLLSGLLDRADLSHPHQRPCAAGQHYLVVDERGGVAKCQMTIRQTVTSIHDADPLLTLRANQHGVQNIPVEEREGCRSCEWRFWCAGGCPIATFRATKRYDVRSPNCGIYQALYPDVIRLEGVRILHHATKAREAVPDALQVITRSAG